ncbi:MAG: hypothetical protein M3O46_22560 [Myxococcota bacterium]|nr:hypothetical protein [Myxococcota bacterium]
MASRRVPCVFLLVTFAFALGCKGNAGTPTADAGVHDEGGPDTGLVDSGDGGPQTAATKVNMDFARVAGWLAAPFPSDDLLRPDGTIDLSGVPNPNLISIVTGAVTLLASDARGFSLTGGAFFTLTGALDPSGMPSLAASIVDGSPVFLMSTDDTAPDFLKRYPVDVTFATDGGPSVGRISCRSFRCRASRFDRTRSTPRWC